MAITTAEARRRGRMGGLATAAAHSGAEMTAPARAARWAQFLDQVDPGHDLDPTERARRAKYAQRVAMTRTVLTRWHPAGRTPAQAKENQR